MSLQGKTAFIFLLPTFYFSSLYLLLWWNLSCGKLSVITDTYIRLGEDQIEFNCAIKTEATSQDFVIAQRYKELTDQQDQDDQFIYAHPNPTCLI